MPSRRTALRPALLFAAFLSMASSCGPDVRAQRTMHVIRTLRAQAARELGCPAEEVRLATDSRGAPIYTATGCERAADYVCVDHCPDGCRLDVDCEALCQVECRPSE